MNALHAITAEWETKKIYSSLPFPSLPPNQWPMTVNLRSENSLPFWQEPMQRQVTRPRNPDVNEQGLHTAHYTAL